MLTIVARLAASDPAWHYSTECSSSLFRFRAPGRLKSIDGNAFLIRLPSSRIARSSGVSGVRSNQPSMVPDWKDHQSMMARQSRWRLLSLIVARVASRGEQGTIPRRGETGYSLAISDNGSIKNRFRGGRSASMFVAVPPRCASTTTLPPAWRLSQPVSEAWPDMARPSQPALIRQVV